MAALYASMSPLTGCEGPTKDQILSKMHPAEVPNIDPNHPVNIDIPYLKPCPEYVDTLCRNFVPAGSARFEVHNMDGIVPGQCLSIGYEGQDLEHFMVARLGSVEAAEPFARDHEELSPVKLVRVSKRNPPIASSGPAGGRTERRTPCKSAEDSDIETEPPKDTRTAPNRKLA